MPYVPHKQGRPARGVDPTSTRSIRFTHDELASLDAHAAKWGFSRAELVREALADAGLFEGPEPRAKAEEAPPLVRRMLRRRERELRERVA